MAAQGRSGAGRGPLLLLHRTGRAARHPVRHLRHDGRSRLGERRGRSQHLGLRGGLDPWLVDGSRPPRLSERDRAAGHRRRRRFQQLPLPVAEGRARGLRRRDGPGDHGLPLPSGNQQVEQDRAPVVLPHHDELARAAPDQPRGGRQPDRLHPYPHRTARGRRLGHQHLPAGRVGQHRTPQGAADRAPRRAGNLELHHPPRRTGQAGGRRARPAAARPRRGPARPGRSPADRYEPPRAG